MNDGNDFETFCSHAYPRLVAALAHQTGDLWLAEELAQEALIRAGDRWSRVSRLASPTGWAFAVGANLGRSHFRRRAAERRAVARLGSEPRTELQDPTDAVMFRAALLELPHKQREAIVLRFYLQLSAHEAAEIMHSTPGAVRAMTHRAITALRVALGPTARFEEANDVS